jgi:hypothetical protein
MGSQNSGEACSSSWPFQSSAPLYFAMCLRVRNFLPFPDGLFAFGVCAELSQLCIPNPNPYPNTNNNTEDHGARALLTNELKDVVETVVPILMGRS